MIRLNVAAEASKDYAAAAALHARGAPAPASARPSRMARIAGWTVRHLELSGLGLLAAILIGLPLGLLAARGGMTGQLILGACGVIQTVPALALLALLVPIPGLGISPRTAILALLLYGLLPIVRNTATGLQTIPPALRESAAALGLEPGAQLRLVFLPLASRTILAGIKTSAIWILATATLAALIGAGGLGEPIVSGLNLNDPATLLEGAIPAALLALLIQGLFEFLDRWIVPRGLRINAGG
jgi:osmoprotectant transport system permease protein